MLQRLVNKEPSPLKAVPLDNLVFNKDGKLDVYIAQNNLDISTLTISKVPSLWGPAIVEIRVWQ